MGEGSSVVSNMREERTAPGLCEALLKGGGRRSMECGLMAALCVWENAEGRRAANIGLQKYKPKFVQESYIRLNFHDACVWINLFML